MSETRKLAAILVADVVGNSRLAGADEDRTLARLRGLHHGRVVKRTGDGTIVEFRSAVDAVLFAIEVQNAMIECNAGVPHVCSPRSGQLRPPPSCLNARIPAF
jgi:adenylate cyclase